ncbi:MAG TPA: hypothetical protein VHG51_06415 [Longimicrobiaceae bacterium]|nr:hypothetical protein [Longimicrobiaceae bacterium]
MEPDLAALERLVEQWRARAESLREGSPEAAASLARADAFDTCAAQLAQALAALGLPREPERDPASLELFR